jgi:hypothetical protein
VYARYAEHYIDAVCTKKLDNVTTNRRSGAHEFYIDRSI